MLDSPAPRVPAAQESCVAGGRPKGEESGVRAGEFDCRAPPGGIGGAPHLARDGWRFGASRHASGAALHQLACEVDLLEAIVLHLAEQVTEAHEAAGAAAGVRAARRLQRSISLIRRAALKGFTDVLFAVRRALRDEAVRAGTEIELDDSLPTVHADSTAIELVLLATLSGMLEHRTGVRLAVESDEPGDQSLRLRVTGCTTAGMDLGALEVARELARLAGGDVIIDESIVVELPASTRQTGDDVVRSGEGDHR